MSASLTRIFAAVGWGPYTLARRSPAQEKRLISVKLKAVQAYVKENRLDRVSHDTDKKRLGIVAAGKAWLDVCQAFEELGLMKTCAGLSALGSSNWL